MSKFRFDSKTHQYFDGNRRLPGVNEILRGTGLNSDLSLVRRADLEYARIRGTYIHKACELWDKKDLKIETLSPALIPYLEGWKKFLKDYKLKFTPGYIEIPLRSTKWGFAGMPDRLPKKLEGKLTLIDIKSEAVVQKVTALKLAAYQILIEDNFAVKIKQRWAVQLTNKGNYNIVPFKVSTDTNTFLCALSVYKWKEINNGKLNR